MTFIFKYIIFTLLLTYIITIINNYLYKTDASQEKQNYFLACLNIIEDLYLESIVKKLLFCPYLIRIDPKSRVNITHYKKYINMIIKDMDLNKYKARNNKGLLNLNNIVLTIILLFLLFLKQWLSNANVLAFNLNNT
jgi:hypothetical protein